MPSNEIAKELDFGIENLERVYQHIRLFSESDAAEAIKTSALTYECVGYYNAIEHLIIRILKYLRHEMPSGEFSHRDTLKAFEGVLGKFNLRDQTFVSNIQTLMAFRHVATKIYGFLIDWDKLETVVATIQTNHAAFVSVFKEIKARLESGKKDGE